MYVDVLSRDVTSRIDSKVLKQYHTDLTHLNKELGIPDPADWLSVLLRLPDVMKQEVESISDEEWSLIEQTINEAVDELISFRKQEGEMMEQVLTSNVASIRSLLEELEPFEVERTEKIKSHLYESLDSLEGIDIDRNRFEQEMIYYIES